MDFELSILEYRQIIKAIKETYDFDYTDYALTSLKRRFELSIISHNFTNADVFIDKITGSKDFFNTLLTEILVESTEMFRDPTLWIYLKDELLPTIIKNNFKIKIWLPTCVSGDELFTLNIILQEEGLEEKVEIIATYFNDNILKNIKSGEMNLNKLDASKENYLRYGGKKEFSNYLSILKENAVRDTSLIKNVKFIKQNINFDNSPQDVKLIIYRNQMIYFNQNLQDKVIKQFNNCLTLAGCLIIGIKEQLGGLSIKDFKIVNEEENIYRKKF
jgi:chemotaxis protein methyltransferase CheR